MTQRKKVTKGAVVNRHLKRSPSARAMDDTLHAARTYKMSDQVGRSEWMKAPNRVDIIGLDTVDILPPEGWVKPKKAVKNAKKKTTEPKTAKPNAVKMKTTKAEKKTKSGNFEYKYVKEYGAATKKKMGSLLDDTMQNFTKEEIAPILKDVEFRHGLHRRARGVAGYYATYHDGSAEIGIKTSVMKNPANAVHTMTHELVHALRAKGKDRTFYTMRSGSRDNEEAQTVAETITRHRKDELESESMYIHPSYYARLGRSEYDKNRIDDKRTMSGNKQHLIGKDAIKSVENNYTKTNIAKMAKQYNGHGIRGVNENIDQHFLIEDKKTKRKTELHIYSPKGNLKPHSAAVFAERLDGIKGDDKVWEYSDGKKKLVIR